MPTFCGPGGEPLLTVKFVMPESAGAESASRAQGKAITARANQAIQSRK